MLNNFLLLQVLLKTTACNIGVKLINRMAAELFTEEGMVKKAGEARARLYEVQLEPPRWEPDAGLAKERFCRAAADRYVTRLLQGHELYEAAARWHETAASWQEAAARWHEVGASWHDRCI